MKKILQLLVLGIGVIAQAQTLVRQFTFNNTFYDTSNTDAFDPFYMAGGSLGYFTTGRDGLAHTAYHFGSSQGFVALISSGLPISNNPRSIAVWVKFNSTMKDYIFSYGSASVNGCFGLTKNNSTQLELYTWGGGNSIFHNQSTAFNTSAWYHLVTSYDGTNIKIYINGVLVKTEVKSINTQTGLFYLGATPQEIASIQADIDDLQIYNGALSDSQVSNLYSNNTLSNNDFQQNNLDVTLYPNPVNDILNIQLEKEIKSIELYSLQGQKILQSENKEIDLSFLASGVYMVRVKDNNEGVVTKRIIKK